MFPFETYDMQDLDDLQRLFHDYHALPEGVIGFRFSLARRIVSLSIEKEACDQVLGRIDSVRSTASLTRWMTGRLDAWLELENPSLDILFMDGSRFLEMVERESSRLTFEDYTIIRNTVRSMNLFVYFKQYITLD